MDNIVLIGMPGCGKSTIGVVLAKMLGYKFIDSDLLIQEEENRLLSEILEEDGHEVFNEIENRVNSAIKSSKTVIATGGSVVYGVGAMEHLRSIGVIVYIKLPYEEIDKRLGNLFERGISMKEDQSLKDIYEERIPLYEAYADIIVDTSGTEIKEAAFLIKRQLEEFLLKK